MHATRNTLSENIRAQSAELLNRQRAGAIDLYGQLKQAHWNVRDPGFMAIHELFDKVSRKVSQHSNPANADPLRRLDAWRNEGGAGRPKLL